MPIVQFQDPHNKQNIVRNMATPKSITKPEAWLKGARKAIPQIPHPETVFIEQFDASLDTIVIHLRNSVTRERYYVAIQRRKSTATI